RVQVRAVRRREDLRASAQAGDGAAPRSIEPMKHQTRIVWAAGVLAGIAAGAVSSSAAAQKHPRTAWGEPDLTGAYSEFTTAPLERAPELGEQEFFTPEEYEVFARERLSQQFDADDTEPGTAADVHYSMGAFALSENEGITSPNLRT